MTLPDIVGALYPQKIGPWGPVLFEKMLSAILALEYQHRMAQSVVPTFLLNVLCVMVGLALAT
jgi:hypothetical protein